jgi:iron complex outermembrane receptor protein
MNRFKLLPAVPLAIMASGTGWAADYPTEQDYLQEFPVVLSASRLAQPISETPNAMTVIDRDMIRTSGVRNIAELFRLVPGMYLSYYKGSQPIVGYHGTTDQYSRRMQVMIDGRSVYLPPASMVDWSNLPITLNDIERIEVIRGPAAASHGANSLHGVISIITKGADQVNGKSVSIRRGNQGINDVSAHFGNAGESFDYRMTVAYTADNGYDGLTAVPNNLPVNPFTARVLNNSNDSNQARLMNFRGNYRPTQKDNIYVQFGVNHDVQGAGFTDSFGNPLHDLIANAGFLQMDWHHQFDVSSELQVRYYHIKNNQSETFTLASGQGVVQSSRVGRDEVELQHTLQTSNDNRLVYGAGWRRDQVAAEGYSLAMLLLYGLPPSYASSYSANEYRLFAHDEWRLSSQVLLNIGGMYERDRMSHESFSPRVALNYHLTPAHTIRVGASVANRTPAVAEERFQTIPQPGVLFVPSTIVTSPGLVPEKVLSREIAYLGEFHDWNASLDMRLFDDEVRNGIFIASTGMFTNGVVGRSRGIEGTLKWSFGNKNDLTVNYAHQRPSSNGPALASMGNTSLASAATWTNDILAASIPANSISLLYSKQFSGGFAVSTAYYQQSKLQPYDRGAQDHQPLQRRVDLRLAKTFRHENGLKGDLSWTTQNLFNQANTEYIVNNLFNRRSYVTLTLDW